MIEAVVTARADENLDVVLQRLTSNNINAIPIMDPDDEGHVLAILERKEIGRAYDKRLQALKSGELAPGAMARSS